MIVKLKTMRLKNWKGANDETYVFQNGINDIVERNGEGKTRRAEAFMWTFFGKDLQDRVNYRIKNEKEPDLRKFDSIVELVLDVDGRENNISRIYSETWQRPRGAEEEVLKGNNTSYSVNGDNTYKKTQFDTFINSWFDETVFKMVSNPLFFNTDSAKWGWKDRRNVLIQMAGQIDNDSVFDEAKDISAARRKILEDVLNEGKDFEQYKKEISGKRKEALAKLEGIPQSIKKLQEVKPENRDWEELARLIIDADNVYKELNAMFTDKSKVDDGQEKVLGDLRAKIRDLYAENELIESKLKNKIKSDNNIIREARANLEADIARIDSRIKQIESSAVSIQHRLEKTRTEHANLVLKYNSRKAEKAPVIDENDTKCPACGEPYKEDEIADKQKHLVENWRVERAKAMTDLKAQVTTKVNEHAEIKKLIADSKKDVDALKKEKADKEAELKVENDKKLAGAPELAEMLKEHAIFQENLANIQPLDEELKQALESKTDEKKAREVNDLEIKRTAADTKRMDLRAQLASKETFDKIETEIKDLTKKEKELNKTIADIEGLEFAISKYSAARNEVVTKRVNKLFRTDKKGRQVTVKMFKPSADGTKQDEHCELWFDDKPYSALNTAAQMWVGLECINTFNQFYELFVPVFIDNRESVNSIPEMDSRVQIINLWVLQEAPAPIVVNEY